MVGLACHVPCTTETDADVRCSLYGQTVCTFARRQSAETSSAVCLHYSSRSKSGSGCGCGLPRHKTVTCKDQFEKRLCACSVVAGDFHFLYRRRTFRSERTALCGCGKNPVHFVRMRMYVAVCTDKLFVHSHGAKAPKSIPQLSVRVCTYILYGRLVRTLRRRYAAPKCAGETVFRFPPSPSPPGNHAEKVSSV